MIQNTRFQLLLSFLFTKKYTKFFLICYRYISVRSLIIATISMNNWTRRTASTSDIGRHQQIGGISAWLNQARMSDRMSGSGVFAWHAQHQSLVATLASIRSSLDHPVEIRVYWREACQLYLVLCNCHSPLLRRSKSSLPFSVVICGPDSDNVMSATAWRFNHCKDHRSVIGSFQINHRQAVWHA